MEDQTFKKAATTISVISLVLGIILLFKEVYCLVFVPDYRTYQDVVYLIAAALFVGLAGTVFDQVFKSFIAKQIKNAIEEYMSKSINSFIDTKVNETIELRMEEEYEEEKKIMTDKDTVIVAVAKTYDWNIENEMYYCQKVRPLQNVPNIAFYKDQTIRELFEFKEAKYVNVNLPEDKQNKQDDLIFYKLTRKVAVLNISHRKGAYIQSRKYVNSQSLLAAKDKTTEDIK